MSTINQVLHHASAILEGAGFVHANREAEVLIGHFAELDTAKIYTLGEDELDQNIAKKVLNAATERIQGRPLAYIIGNQHFMSWELKSDERALIPRPETEQLVEYLVKKIREIGKQKGKTLEIGTGSGNISIALKKYFPDMKILATDISEEALELAEDNANKLGVEIDFIQSDLLKNVKPDKFDLIVANLPYVPSDRLAFVSEQILDWEPIVAIVAGEDGLKYISELIKEVGPYLNDRGLLALEMWHTHGEPVTELAKEYLGEDTEVKVEPDLAGYDRFAFIEVS